MENKNNQSLENTLKNLKNIVEEQNKKLKIKIERQKY